MPVYKNEDAQSDPWYFEINYTENGKYKKKKKRGFKTKKAAEAAMVETLNELNKGTYVEPSKLKYKDFLNDYLNDKRTKVKARTLETYTGLVNNHIIPYLGENELSKLTPRMIQDLYNTLFETGRLADENIQKVHTIINESLNKAVSWDMLAKNPAAVVERPRARKKEMLFWDDNEVQTFLNSAQADRYFHAFLLALTTGMRQGEILGLRWKDVDFENRTISIQQTLQHDGKTFQTGTKTESGNRSIGVDKVTLAALKKLLARCREERIAAGTLYQDFGLVICTSVGTPVSPRNLNRTFYNLVGKAGVKQIRFHDLRHTHVVYLLKMRENNKRIAERLGWASVKMIDKYAHIVPHMQQETADAFGELFYRSQN